MPTNLDLDDELIDQVKRLGGYRTKKEAVTAALQEYIEKRGRQRVIEAFGTVDFDEDYDYKAERKRDAS